MTTPQTISTESIKASLRNPEGKDRFKHSYCAYIADRLPDIASPQSFHAEVDRIVREIIDGKSSDPFKPVPPLMSDHAKTLGSFLLDDIMGLAQEYCPPDFADGVYAAHKRHYG